MRIEKYGKIWYNIYVLTNGTQTALYITDTSLWEPCVAGSSPVPHRQYGEVAQLVEQRIDSVLVFIRL